MSDSTQTSTATSTPDVPENPVISPDAPYDASAPENTSPASASAPTPTTPANPDTEAPTGGEAGVKSAVDTDGDGSPDVVHATDASGTDVNAYLDDHGNVMLVEADTDGNGTFDTLVHAGADGTTIVEVDSDDDGQTDTIATLDANGQLRQVDTLDHGHVVSSTIDVDGDGTPDVQLVDTDHDGGFDATILDVDNDGKADTVLRDTDGDGQADAMGHINGGADDSATPDDDPSVPEDDPSVPDSDAGGYDDHAAHDSHDIPDVI